MDDKDLNIYLSRILSGFFIFIHNNITYKLIYPDINIKYQADLYSENERENNKYNSWLNDQEILYYLISNNLWTHNGDDELEKLSKQIEDYKVELFKNFLNPSKYKSIKKNLQNFRSSYNKLYSTRHSFDHLTLDGYCDILKSQYILIHSLYDQNNNRIFNNLENSNYLELNSISHIVMKNSIDIFIFRKIARSEIWKNYWSANKDKLFDKPTINWTDEQRSLVIMSKMYDSAYEHTECPTDKVFEDDDAFDGWMINQRRENEKQRSKGRAEKMLQGKGLDKAQEVFIMANSQDEANDIYNLNDNVSKSIIKERNNIISNRTIQDSDLPDVRRNLMMEQNKQIMERARK